MSENAIVSNEKYSKLSMLIATLVGGIIGFVAAYIIYIAKGWSLKFSSPMKMCLLWGVFVIDMFWYLISSGYELIVTDKRIYGKTPFGKRVDLPIDSVSAVGAGLLNSITISTASGRISFYAIKNRNKIHKVISDLLIERQSKPLSTATVHQEIPQSNADELKKYKDLLDSGVISQEEFDAKKKQLLGL